MLTFSGENVVLKFLPALLTFSIAVSAEGEVLISSSPLEEVKGLMIWALWLCKQHLRKPGTTFSPETVTIHAFCILARHYFYLPI